MSNCQSNDRDSLLLTITLPIKDSAASPFHAVMLSFPHGAVQAVLEQLHSREALQMIFNGLEQNPEKLGELSAQMAGKGCPGVEITPVEMVGYYQLQTDSIQMNGEMQS